MPASGEAEALIPSLFRMKDVVFLILSDILFQLSAEVGLPVFQKFHADGDVVESPLEVVADFAAVHEPDGVFLGHHHDGLGRTAGQSLFRGVYVLHLEGVVVAEDEGLPQVVAGFEPGQKTGRVGDPDHGDHGRPLREGSRLVVRGIERFRRLRDHPGEVEALVGIEVEVLADDPVVEGFHLLGTLGDDHYLSPRELRRTVAQPSEGQHAVFVDGVVVVHQDDVDPGLDVAVLEGVVQYNQVHLRMGFAQPLDPFDASFADGDGDVGVLEFDLFGFVADFLEGAGHCGEQETFGLPFVAAREDGDVEFAVEQLDEAFGVGGLAGAADGEVPHADDGDVEFAALQHAPVEQPVADVDHAAVEPGQRGGEYGSEQFQGVIVLVRFRVGGVRCGYSLNNVARFIRNDVIFK